MKKPGLAAGCTAAVLALAACAGCAHENGRTAMFEEDVVETSAGDLTIGFVGHGTLVLTFGETVIHVDPVSREADYATMPKADVILITHGHGDHLDPEAIAAVREDQLHSSEACTQLTNQQLAAIAILGVGRMHHQGDDQPQRVDDQMPLAARDLLTRIVTAVPPFSVVLTDWLSMMPTLGTGFLPTSRRTCPRSRSRIFRHVPLRRKQR